MRVGAWDDGDRPFIFVSPQNDVPPFSTTEWNIAELDAFFSLYFATIRLIGAAVFNAGPPGRAVC